MGLFNGAILLFLRPLVGIYELSGATMELAIQLAVCGLLLGQGDHVAAQINTCLLYTSHVS